MIRRIAVAFAAVSLAACSGGTKGSSGSTASSTASSTTATLTSGSSGATSGSASTGSSGSVSTSGSSGSASSGSSGASSGSSGSSGSTGEGAPTITSVTVEGATAAEVRQGATANAHIHGINLDNATAVVLGTTALTPSSDTATEIVAPVTAAHGATLGALDLTVTTPNGSDVETGAVTITPIVVAPTGDDTAPGVPSAPFKTLTQAFTVAQSDATSTLGDTVQLMPGSFGSSAETFPSAATPAGLVCNVKDGVTLAGVTTDAGNPLILDDADGGSATASPIVPCGSMTLSDVDVQGFGYGSVVLSGSLSISNMHQSGAAQDGIYVSGSNALVSIATNSGAQQHSSFNGNGASGLHVLAGGTLTAGGFDAMNNAEEGVRIEGADSSSLRFARLDGNAAAGAFFSGDVLVNIGPSVEASSNGQGIVFFNVTRTAAMDGVTIEGNTGDGLFVFGTSNGLNVTNSFVDTNFSGLHVDLTSGAVSVGTTSFVVNNRGLLVRGQPTSVNLNATGSGSNTVRGNLVNLDVDVSASALVSMRGVVFDGTDGGAAFPDASPSGGETWGWTYPADGGIQYISSTGQSLAPLEWDPDAGEGPFNYLLWDGGGSIQF